MKRMKILFYCTKSKWQLFRDIITGKWLIDKIKNKNAVNGKIVAECDYEVEEIRLVEKQPDGALDFETRTLSEYELCIKSCLSPIDLDNYLSLYGYGKGTEVYGYAIHIKNLHIFDEPKELSDYEDEWEYPLKKAPQNMRRCFSTLYSNIEADMPIRTYSYILISIHPKHLCKELNGEKTIEVRKKVLKEMRRSN